LNVAETVSFIEAAGASFRLEGEKVRVWYPDQERREELATQVSFLRARRAEVAALLKARRIIPTMPPGVRLVAWNLKEPPIAIEYHAVVTDAAKFAGSTLGELRERLTSPKRKYGWTVSQLIDRLAQVGVTVALEPAMFERHARSRCPQS
jgi:hypothetical protein